MGQHLDDRREIPSGCVGTLDPFEFAKEKLENIPEEQIRPRPLLTGHDLIHAGYKPGPQFKELLTAVEEAQLEGSIGTREEAMEMVRKLLAGK